MSGWRIEQLTRGTDEGRFHSHSYYDIHVFDRDSRWVVGYETAFTERHPSSEDIVEVGLVDTDQGQPNWLPIGESRAWSWQQGPMAQFVPGRREVIWNDRRGSDAFANRYDLATKSTTMLDKPVYAISPDGSYALSLNFDRLDVLRPGYGYASPGPLEDLAAAPGDDGVWKIDLETGQPKLILSLRKAAILLATKFGKKAGSRFAAKAFRNKYLFWFNHLKVSPSGDYFTVKLRFRPRDLSQDWNDRLGVSLVVRNDGRRLRLLTDATSHVIWLDDEQLYLWQRNGLYLYRHDAGGGTRVGQIAADEIKQNVHARHFANDPTQFIFDTPYREDIDLKLLDTTRGHVETIATFHNHVPVNGAFRCDLHPCPSPDSQKIVVTSLQNGGRQMYLLRRP